MMAAGAAGLSDMLMPEDRMVYCPVCGIISIVPPAGQERAGAGCPACGVPAVELAETADFTYAQINRLSRLWLVRRAAAGAAGTGGTRR